MSQLFASYWPGEFLFQYPIILPFHTVHGVLKARILKWVAIPFSSGRHSVRPLHHDPPVLAHWNHTHWKLLNLITLGPQPCLTQWNYEWAMATQDRRVMLEHSDKTWSTGEEKGKPLQYSCLKNPMNSMKRQKDRTLKDELPRWVGVQYATRDRWRNKSRKNEETEPKQKHLTMDVTGDGSQDQGCKEQYCIGTWNIRSMNQGKFEAVKQKMARVNTDILGISELKWTGL